jgi:hypothetical protein
MTRMRILQTVLALAAAYAALLLPGFFWPGWFESAAGRFLLLPALSVYLFDALGVPWLLADGGRCDWGWCSPSAFGWLFLTVFWLGLCWLLVWSAAALASRLRRR